MMDQAEQDVGGLGLASGHAYRFVTRLLWLYGGFTILVLAGLASTWLPLGVVSTQAQEAVAGGLGGLVLSTLLMALTALFAVQLLAASRQRHFAAQDGEIGVRAGRFSLPLLTPGVAARQGQAFMVGLGTALTCFVSWLLWPMARSTPVAMADPNLVGAIAIAIAFCSLVGERMMAAFPAPQMP
jgi:hypothetical protein